MPLPRVEVRVRGARGHIAFFRKMVRPPDVRIEPGSLVEVYDREGGFVGRGFYNPKSEIAVRIVAADEAQGGDFLPARLKAARSFRNEVLRLPEVTEAYRLCHAEGDGLSGLVVDRFGPVLVAQLFSRGFFLLRDRLKQALGELVPGSRVLLTADETVQKLEGFSLPVEQVPEEVVVQEHGVHYRIDFRIGHKTGFFCDQRDNRWEVGRLARGRDVLDLCTFTGGFALQASRGGAKRVVGVDLDEEALEVARQNARLNHAKIEFLHADLFNYLRQTKDRFDLVVLDPSKMARNREEIGRAHRAYRDMNILALKVARPGALLVSCSCSGLVAEAEFLAILQEAGRVAGRELAIFRIAGAGPDHPVSTYYPEGRYLKVVFGRVL